MSRLFCAHERTTEPDDDGYVICLECAVAIRRPETIEEIIRKLKA